MKKKIGILTWYKSINHGAILQAYALQEVIKKNGNNVIELDYKRNVQKYNYSKLDRIKSAFKKFNLYKLIIKFQQKKFNTVKKQKFKLFENEFLNVGKMYNDNSNKIDLTIIGSDMVFDFFEGYNPFMYGKDVSAKEIISYAACFGYTTKETFDKFEHKNDVVALLRKFSSISYRDDNTGMILKDCCNLIGKKVIDPVLLYGFDKEKSEWCNHNWKNKKYLLIYSYDYNMNNYDEVRNIKKFAKENDLITVSVGYNHPWCDEIVNADPCEFVELFANASYVVTDTYHGTVFSITLNKQFCVTIRNNAFKILDILNDLKIKNDFDKNIYEKLIELKKNPLNYSNINLLVEKYRKSSIAYLKDNLES